MALSRADKDAFFRELELLDCETDGEDDEFRRLVNFFENRSACASSDPVSASAIEGPTAPSRASTGPLPASANVSEIIVNRGADLAIPEKISAKKQQKVVTKSISTNVMPAKGKTEAASGRRKRKSFHVSVPVERHIFKGLIFFFFPNNDISPLRRMRIHRAQDYGASWAEKLDDTVTHIIVDKDLTYQDVLKHLGPESLLAKVAIVNDTYTPECIGFREVLSPTRSRFRVKGIPVPAEAKEAPPANEPPSMGSLPIKATGKGELCEIETQSSEDEDTNDLSEPLTNKLREDAPGGPAPNRERDALDDLVEEAKALKDLPLEMDSDKEEDAAEASDSETSDSSGSRPVKKKRKAVEKEDEAVNAWQQKFACMQKHDSKSTSENPNSRTIAVLQQMLDYYTRTDDHWRTLAYRKAISALRRQPKKIVTKSQALAITGIGERLADKIEEIVYTNRLRRLENATTTPEDRILQLFLGVYGAGITQASSWMAQGFETLEDLKTKASLTQQQRVGVDHYYDFSQRIPRKEVETHGEIVRKAVRRVDFITKPDAKIEQIRTIILALVVPRLFKQGFLQASLASTSRDGSKWHGASMLPGGRLWRRIDLLFVPDSEIGAALIYFTGNDIFNRSMRLLASKKGMRLNQRGLYTDVLRGPQRAKLTQGRLLEGRDERRIFAILGVPWRPPEHRIC